MRRILLSTLSLLAAGVLSCPAATVDNTTSTKPRKFKKPASRSTLLAQKRASIMTGLAQQKPGVYAAPAANDEPVATMTSNGGWGTLENEDGTTWYYTTSLTASGYYYGGAQVTIYNNKHEQAAQFDVQLPEGKSVNSIAPYGVITSKFFDLNDKTKEVLVGIHAVGDASNNYQGAYYTQVYNLDGTLAQTYNGNGVQVNIQQNSWTKYQRLILVNDSSVVTGNVDDDGYAETKDYECYDILKPASWGNAAPVVEHQFKVNLDLTYYSNGQPFNIYTVDNTPYYAIAKYEKPYVSGYDATTWDPIVTENNHYTVVVYDKNFKQQDSLGVAFTTPSDALYRMPGFGEMSTHDLSKGFYSDGGKFDYVITVEDYITSKDDYCYSFFVYNSTDGQTKTICTDVYNTWGQLADIEGQEEQWYFMQEIGSAQQVQTVNLPSCEAVTTFPSTISGELISTSLNRYPTKGGYKYIMKLGQGTSDDAGNVIARLGWYNAEPTATLDHYVSFNLGPDAENFSANLQSTVLNPYLFNTDDQLEFFYIAKVKDNTTGKLANYLFVADEQGNVLKQFNFDENKGALYTAIIRTDNVASPELEVIYKDDNDRYSFDFFSLPFTKFAGGDGTADNPYLIATMGDLQQVVNEPTASYKFANDIDADVYPVAWTPIDNFSGSLDGDGHYLANLVVSADESTVGLFGTMGDGAKVKNLNLLAPTVTLKDNNQYVGVLAGTCIGDTIQNVHVFDAQVSGDGSATIGGLVGQGALYTYISSSSFNGTINAPSASPVGGIAGDTRTSSYIEAVAVSGDFTAASNLGGIVGTTGSESPVVNAHSSANLTAGNTVGGIVGENGSRGTIQNCVTEGTLTANHLQYPNWQKYSLGGIVGTLASNWTGTYSYTVVNGCVSLANLVAADNDGTVHRIAGYTIANEDDSNQTEGGMANNYAAASSTINGGTLSSTDATSVEGADQQTLDTDFFTSLKYAFGTTTTEPWKATMGVPVLYFENSALALTLDKDVLNLEVNGDGTVTATVYGSTADDLEFESSDNNIVTIDIEEQEGNTCTLKLTGKGDGTATVTVSINGHTATVTVNVGTAAAIENATIENGNLHIAQQDGFLHAEGATSLTIYSVNGQTVARRAGESLCTNELGKGLYIVVATDAKGNTAKAKVIIK